MSSSSKVLRLERFDPKLEPNDISANLTELADYLNKQKAPFPLTNLRPTISYLVETEELVATRNVKQQIELTRIFILSFYLTAPNFPVEAESNQYIYKMFHLIAQTLPTIEEKNKKLIKELIQKANEIDFFVIPRESTTISELFDCLLSLEAPEALISAIHMLNATDRIPLQVIQDIIDNIKNQGITDLIRGLSTLKQNEVIQSIRSVAQGEEIVLVAEKVSDILEVAPIQMFASLRGEIISEDVKTRTTAVRLFAKTLVHQKLNKDSAEYFSMCLERHHDAVPEIRAIAIKFAISVIQNIKDIKETGYKCDTFVKTIWDAVEDRLTDSSAEVRLNVLKGLRKIKPNEIKVDLKTLAKKLQDKSADVRNVALKIMLDLYNKEPSEMEWLEPMAICAYPTLKEVPLIAFANFIEKRSLIDIISNLENRAPLLLLLRDTNTFRVLLPRYKEDMIAVQLDRLFPVKEIPRILRAAPKFFEQALDIKMRSRILKMIKKKLETEDANLIMGLYQPSPIKTEDVLECGNPVIAKELASIFAEDFEAEIPAMIRRMNEVDLQILSQMRDVDLSGELKDIMKALSTAINGEHRKLALKAMAALYRPGVCALPNITFKKDEFNLKMRFYARLKNAELIPKNLIKELYAAQDKFDANDVKWALRLAQVLDEEKCIEFHSALVEKWPAEAFSSYLEVVDRCFRANTPEVFRRFAEVIQAYKPEVRMAAITALNRALLLPRTPIQFLALFALSATDPVKENVKEAEECLSRQIKKRRDIAKQIKKMKGTVTSQVQPETALTYLINILAHHKDFEHDSEELSTFGLYLRFFIKPLCADTKDFDYILEILRHMKYADDVEEEFTPNMVRLCDIAVAIVREIGGGRVWEEPSSQIEVQLPVRYFKPCEDPERIKGVLMTPLDLIKSPARPRKVLNAGMSPLRSTRVKRSGKALAKNAPAPMTESEDESESEEETPTPKRSPRRSPAPKKEEEPKKKGSKSSTPKRSPTPKKETPKRSPTPKKETPKKETPKKETPKKETKKSTPKRSPTPKKATATRSQKKK